MAKKILVIAESIDIDSSSGPKANMTMISNLHKAGFVLKVIHTTKKSISLEGIETLAVRGQKYTFINLLTWMQRSITRFTGIKLHELIERIFGFSFAFFNDTNFIAKCVRNDTSFQPDIVLTLSQGASFRPHYAVLQVPELHSKWIAYIHDPYPFHCYPPPYNWVQPGYKKKEKFFKDLSESAKYSAFPSKLLQDWMGKTFPAFLKNGVIIPHQLPDSTDVLNEAQSYIDVSKFSLLYSGNISSHRNPGGLLEGYVQFLTVFPEAAKNTQLLFVGASDDFASLISSYVQKSSSISLVNQHLPFGEVLQLQNLASVNIILESKSYISPFLPGKFPHCVYANKKILILGPEVSESHRLLGSDYLYWAEADDAIKIKNLIVSLYTNWLSDNKSTLLNRPDLNYYCSGSFLKQTINQLSF